MTFAQIAERLEMDEKSVRESFHRFITKIIPLLISAPADGKAAELLRELEEIRQRLLLIASTSENDSAVVGALREAAKTVQQEYEIRRALGLMPKLHGDKELRFLAEKVAELLRARNIPAAVIEELVQLFETDGSADQ